MALHHNHKTISEQIKVLEERGLIVDDPSILENINYSHLIYKFGKLYIDSYEKDWTPRYKPGTKLSNIYNLYKLNLKVSKEIFNIIGLIESKFKASLAYVLSRVDPLFHYLMVFKPSKFLSEEEFDKFKSNLKSLEKDRKGRYESKYLLNGKMPIWLLVDEMAFGQLRMMLKHSRYQKDILRRMNLYNYKDWIKLVTVNKYRNVSHHYNTITPAVDGHKFVEFMRIIKVMEPDAYKLFEDFINDDSIYVGTNLTGQQLRTHFGI